MAQVRSRRTGVRPSTAELKEIARQMRTDIIKMTSAAGSGHPSSSLSMVEFLTVLYCGGEMRYDAENPKWEGRDRLILSKGHAVPGLYAALMAAGILSRDLIPTLRRLGSILQGHADMRFTPGIEASAGSLGQGLSIGIGHALAARLDHRDYRVYVITGDGEIDEGQNWEAAMTANKYKIDNLCLIVDRNNAQQTGWVPDVMPTDPLSKKFAAYGWNVVDIDGHNYDQVYEAFERARGTKGVPTAIVAHTIKGKGVSFMEKDYSWHGRVIEKPEMIEQALKEIETRDIGS
ncbi:MAG: transketolase [Rudaea sp.]